MPRKIPTYRAPGMPTPEQNRRTYDRRTRGRQADKAFYSSAAWRKFRASYLKDNPSCASCLKEGRTTAANHVHHIKERRDFPELSFEESNMASLCAPCHSKLASWGR